MCCSLPLFIFREDFATPPLPLQVTPTLLSKTRILDGGGGANRTGKTTTTTTTIIIHNKQCARQWTNILKKNVLAHQRHEPHLHWLRRQAGVTYMHVKPRATPRPSAQNSVLRICAWDCGRRRVAKQQLFLIIIIFWRQTRRKIKMDERNTARHKVELTCSKTQNYTFRSHKYY